MSYIYIYIYIYCVHSKIVTYRHFSLNKIEVVQITHLKFHSNVEFVTSSVRVRRMLGGIRGSWLM